MKRLLARRCLLAAAFALAACDERPTAGSCCDVAAVAARTEAAVAAAADPAATARRNAVQIPDVTLIDQDGKKVRLMTDLVRGRKVIANFVFSTCTSVCPTLQTVFEGVQDKLGKRLGDEVVMLSISVDPATDTPERMAAFAADYHAGPGWRFLTGSTEDVVAVLKAFNVYTLDKEEHSAMFVLGNEPTGRWMFQSGFVDARVVVQQLESLCKPD